MQLQWWSASAMFLWPGGGAKAKQFKVEEHDIVFSME